MPIFEFKCLSCNECFEILVLKKKEEVEARCPKCGSEEFERVLSKTCYAMAPGSGKSGGASAQTRTCSSGSPPVSCLTRPLRFAGRSLEINAIASSNGAIRVEVCSETGRAVVRVADEVVVDLLAAACGVEYEEARRDAITLDFAGVPIPVASPRTLLRTKNTTRPSDAADRQFLQALIDEASR